MREAAELALLHRRRRQPFEEPGLDRKRLEESIRNWRRDRERPEGNSERGEKPLSHDPPECEEEPQEERIFEADPPYRVRPILTSVRDEIPRSETGRRSKSRTNSKAGRYVGSMIPRGKVTDLALDATLRAAAPFQARRRKENPGSRGLIIESFDLRQKVRERKVGNLILFVLDASGSMAAEERMAAAKGAVLSLLIDAYQRRDRVGMVVFRGERAKLVLPPTNSVELARKLLRELPTGGRTPLASGLKLAFDIIEQQRRKEKETIPLLVLISDGRANASLESGDPVEEAKKAAREIREANIRSIAIDTERGFPAFGLVREICDEMGGIYLRLEELRSEPIASAVRENLGCGSKRT